MSKNLQSCEKYNHVTIKGSFYRKNCR